MPAPTSGAPSVPGRIASGTTTRKSWSPSRPDGVLGQLAVPRQRLHAPRECGTLSTRDPAYCRTNRSRSHQTDRRTALLAAGETGVPGKRPLPSRLLDWRWLRGGGGLRRRSGGHLVRHTAFRADPGEAVRPARVLAAEPADCSHVLSPRCLRRMGARDTQDGGNEYTGVLAALLDAGADISMPDEEGHTALHFATRSQEKPAAIAKLLDAGADPNARKRDGDTPLHEAATSNRSLSVIAALLDAGAESNARGQFGNTPLHQAAQPMAEDHGGVSRSKSCNPHCIAGRWCGSECARCVRSIAAAYCV